MAIVVTVAVHGADDAVELVAEEDDAVAVGELLGEGIEGGIGGEEMGGEWFGIDG